MDLGPVGIKYWGGWGEGVNPLNFNPAGVAASAEEIIKALKKEYSLSDRRYIASKWKRRYLFYADTLFDEDDQSLVMNDSYLRNLNKELGLS